MDTNFHAFVFISTVVFYIILKSYKRETPKHTKNSNLIYVIAVPFVLYGGHYFFSKSKTLETQGISQIKASSVSEDLLTIPYPISSDTSSI